MMGFCAPDKTGNVTGGWRGRERGGGLLAKALLAKGGAVA